jgi:hypothetical protein
MYTNLLKSFVKENVIVPVIGMKIILIDWLGRESSGVISDISTDGLPIVNDTIIKGTWVPDITHDFTYSVCKKHVGSYRYP